MRKLSWIVALAVFAVFFGAYSFRLGIQPVLMHDDFEYTYPSFSLAEHGSFGSPLLGPGLNIRNRTYNLIVYYYASVHAVLIRIFGNGPQSIPLANTFHYALLAAVGTLFLLRRHALVGLFVFLYALVRDGRMVEAARHGRPEMSAGFYVTLAVILLWLWLGEGRRGTLVLIGATASLTAAMLTHTSAVFFTLALTAAFAVPVWRQARPRQIVIGILPVLTIPLLYGYFLLTDDVLNLKGQFAIAQGNVGVGRLLLLALTGEWRELSRITADFVRTQADPRLWLGLLACALLPRIGPHSFSASARFFAGVYVLLFLVNYLCLKHFVLTYQPIYQATAYFALAFLAEAAVDSAGQWMRKPAWTRALRVAGISVFAVLAVRQVAAFRGALHGQRAPFAALQGALTYVLLESGARPGDKVLTPSPFGFHLKGTFDVIAHPAAQYFRGRWSEDFRRGLREVWGRETLSRLDAPSLCYAMGLSFIQPTWVLTWDFDYSTMQPFYQFLRKYPDVPGMQVTRLRGVALPPPYGGSVRVYRLAFTDAVDHLDHSLHSAEVACP